MGAITAQHSTQSCANSTEILPFGPSVSTKSCVIVSGEQHTGSLAFHGALQSCLHTGGWVAWLLDGSCMSREAHVQFCESLGVRFPGATHRNIYVRSRRAGQRLMGGLTRLLEGKLKLKVNREKSAVARPWERKFLGFSFTNGRQPKRRIAPKAKSRFEARVRILTRRTRGISIETMVRELGRYLQGWQGYFGFCQTPTVLDRFNKWIRRRIRSAACKQWRTGKTR